MKQLVKITADPYGNKVKFPEWCLSVQRQNLSRNLCANIAYSTSEHEIKESKRGRGITCPNCIEYIEEIKSVKL